MDMDMDMEIWIIASSAFVMTPHAVPKAGRDAWPDSARIHQRAEGMSCIIRHGAAPLCNRIGCWLTGAGPALLYSGVPSAARRQTSDLGDLVKSSGTKRTHGWRCACRYFFVVPVASGTHAALASRRVIGARRSQFGPFRNRATN